MKFETFDTTFLLIFEIIIILQFVLQNIRLVIPDIKFDLNKYIEEHGRSQSKIKRKGGGNFFKFVYNLNFKHF